MGKKYCSESLSFCLSENEEKIESVVPNFGPIKKFRFRIQNSKCIHILEG